MKKFFPLFALFMAMFSACSAKASTAVKEYPGDEIPFPEIPAAVLEPSDRADYVLLHFYDPFDFDMRQASDSLFMERNFVNFVQFYQFASPEGASRATKALLARAEEHPEAFSMLCSLGAKYLYQYDSPYYNEPAYVDWLRYIISSEAAAPGSRERARLLLELALKNFPGTKAADFRFLTRDGRETTLRAQLSAPYTLLVFYSPTCEDCHDMIARLQANKDVTALVDRGTVKVVAVTAEDERPEWDADKSSLPAKWVVGYDLDNILDREVYVCDHTPTVYLLDRQGTVLLKDATEEQLTEYARTH